ncbi:hypothetical protein RUM43_008114, partial [Polyplax serrata]
MGGKKGKRKGYRQNYRATEKVRYTEANGFLGGNGQWTKLPGHEFGVRGTANEATAAP